MGSFRAFLAVALLGGFAAGAHAHEESGQAVDTDRAMAASQAAIGKKVGDYDLLDQNAAPLRFSDYRGKPLIVSFIYTACSDVCPTSTRFLMEAVREARRALGPERFDVVTLGFNQPFDTPQALAAFARQNGIRDPRWKFVASGEKTMKSLTRDLGFSYFPQAGGFDHISQISIVDPAGVVYRQVYGDSFELPMLVEPLKELLGGEARRDGFAGVWDKVKLFCTVYDPNTGRYRVNYSLFVELFTGASVLIAIAGFLVHEHRRSRIGRG